MHAPAFEPVTAPVGERILVGMSGGVDSAVAALVLRAAGHDVHGLFMSNWDEADTYCTVAEDYQDARRTAHDLGITLHRVSFAAEYRAQVFQYLLEEYRAGRTPNPDVLCNREIKFGLFADYAERLGARWIATGHYARHARGTDGPVLLQARDRQKDQTYFLHGVPRGRFERVLFPLGELTKPEVRERARRAGLAVHDKPDSTGICFIGERPFSEFLARYIAPSPGPIESLDGRLVGRHRGLPFYTIGQRSGLLLGGARGFAGEAWYVVRKVPERNALIVTQGQHESLDCEELETGAVNWLCAPPTMPFEAEVRLRHRQALEPAQITPLAGGGVRVRFARAQRAATEGQFAVLYAAERCLGGGAILATRSAHATHARYAQTPI